MISLIHPSRGRPEKSIETVKKWRTNAIDYIQVVVSVDSDDELIEDYEYYYEANPAFIVNKNRSAIDAINRGAKIAYGDIIIVVSDDTDCIPGWDRFLTQWLHGKSDFICKVADGIQPWIITMPIMDRAYYNRFGYIYHPDYQHMFCDTELTCVADLTGRKLTSNILFKHNHYSVTKEQPDAVNKKADATWAQGEKLFLERYKRNFDLKPEDIKGKIQDNGMINWLQRKAR